MQRSSRESIQAAYDYIFRSGHSLLKLKETAIAGRIPNFQDDNINIDEPQIGHVGRSILWKLFLVPVPPLTSPLARSPTPLVGVLREQRSRYVRLLKVKMRAPDGSYEEGLIIPGETTITRRQSGPPQDWGRNNPLSLDNENPWQDWFQAMDLRKTIAQDVERTFPEIFYFRQPHVQANLTNILFLHSISNPDIGYRQGMHEILAPILYALDYDSIDSDAGSDAVHDEASEFCSRRWIAADAWALFDIVMRGANSWYEWKEPMVEATTNGPMRTEAWVAPIVRTCNSILEDLRTVDPALYAKLVEVGVEPQIYGIRWLRLLFSREFPMPEVMPLWDAIFAADPSLGIAKWVCMAMLMRIRNKLVVGDYSTQLTTLLRYPADTPIKDFDSPHTTLLLRQALAIRASPTPSTGASIVMENRNFLGIDIEFPEPNSPPRRRKSTSSAGPRPSTTFNGMFPDSRKDQGGLPELIASRLQDANSVLFNTVSELRRNLPEISASLIRTPTSPEATAFPYQSVIKTPQDRPTPEPRSRFELERELAEAQALQKKLGRAMEWSLNLLRTNDGAHPENNRDALECLTYVRDVLLQGGVVQIDDTRLVRRRDSSEAAQPSPEFQTVDLRDDPPLSRRHEPPKAPPAVQLPVSKTPPNSPPRASLENRLSKLSVSLPRSSFHRVPSPPFRWASGQSSPNPQNVHRPSYSTSTLPLPSSRPSSTNASPMTSSFSRSPANFSPPLRNTMYTLPGSSNNQPGHSPSSSPSLTSDPLGALR